MRKPFQGICNIICFNWPYYALSAGFVLLMLLFRQYSDGPLKIVADVSLLLVFLLTLVSLLVSWYVYDLSGFYRLDWLSDLPWDGRETIVNINAGFDETSTPLSAKFKDAEMIVFDFYDPEKHTAASIKRARQAYPPFPATREVSTDAIPLTNGSAGKIFAILSVHEIRNADERICFFKELHRIMAPSGTIVVAEHPRDAANYLAYNIGALHFHPRAGWIDTFKAAGLELERETKVTPFITAFFLKKNGTAP